MTTWQQWRSQHPDTLVLDKRGRYRFDPYERYYVDRSRGIIGESVPDSRLPVKELVLGVEVDGQGKAYPLRDLEKRPTLNDTLAGQEILIAYDPRSGTALAFNRQVDGRTLTFERVIDDDQPQPLLRDKQTGSRWFMATGHAFEGSLAGKNLKPLIATYSFWFAWTDFHPNSPLFTLDEGANTPS